MNDPNIPHIPEVRPQAYVIDVYSERTGGHIHRVTDATMQELQDLVCFYHSQLEENKKYLERAINGTNLCLGYDEL